MRKCVGVLVMLCLITSSAFATNSWTASTGSWGTASNWRNGGGLSIVPDDTEQVKINGGTTCTLDTTAVTFVTNKVTVGTSATQANLNITSTGSLTSTVEIQVGDASGKIGSVTQIGGTVSLNGTSSKDSKLEVGYKGGPGYYTISGGSILTGANLSQLLVGPSGSASGGIGTFTVDGKWTDGSINVSKLYVGTQDSIGTYTGSGTLAFNINGGVNAINAGLVCIDPNKLNTLAIANLNITKTGALPGGDILLINNTGNSGVTGSFDNVAWGGTITLGGVAYTLTNTYVGGGDLLANDVALIIPEPATIALLGLGLLALRRNKK
jgi:hypothetical protein